MSETTRDGIDLDTAVADVASYRECLTDPHDFDLAMAALRAAVAGRDGEIERVMKMNADWHVEYRKAQDRADHWRRAYFADRAVLGAVAALADEWKAAEKYRPAGSYPEATSYADGRNHQREMDADELDDALGPVSGAVEGAGRCGYVECDGQPVDQAAFINERMDHMNGEDGFCRRCLTSMADPLGAVEGAGDADKALSKIERALASRQLLSEWKPGWNGLRDEIRPHVQKLRAFLDDTPVAGHEQEVRAEERQRVKDAVAHLISQPIPFRLDEHTSRLIDETIERREAMLARASGSSAPGQGDDRG